MLLVVKNWKCYPGSGQCNTPDSKVHGANTEPTWGRQDPSGLHVGHVNLAIWDGSYTRTSMKISLRIRGTGTNGNYYWMMAYVITLCQLFGLPIALNFQLSLPHLQTAHFFPKVWCTVQWSPSGFILFALITPKGTSRRLCWLTEQNPQQRTFPTLSLFGIQSPFKFWTWMMFCRYWWWHSSYVTDIYEFLFLYLAPLLMTGNRLGTKQTWAITRQTEVFSRLQWITLQQCVQYWPEPSSHHIETWHHHTRRFNAKWNTTQAMLDGGETWIWILGVWCETGPG